MASPDAGQVSPFAAALQSRLMRAARREPVDTTPVWIMRQAGRYLPEYMQVRRQVTFIDLCKRPELATEVTVTAQRVLGVDAAILFADLLPILEPMGFDLEYQQGEGPVIHNPLTGPSDAERVREVTDMAAVDYTLAAVQQIRAALPVDIPLLGFAGAPFTLASYAIEGGGSKNYLRVKTFMHSAPQAWDQLMRKLTHTLTRYLNAQLAAGCQAVQVFDSWAGCLSPADYQRFVLPYTRLLIENIVGGPVINFLTGNPALLELQRSAGGQIMGVDWRVELAAAWDRFGPDVAVQGNLDPTVLHNDFAIVKREAERVLASVRGRNGHIFNLGHGVFPDTPHENVKALVQWVHDQGPNLPLPT